MSWYYRDCWHKRRLKPYELLWVKFWIKIENICRLLHGNLIYYGFFKQTKYFLFILVNKILRVKRYYCVWASDGVYCNKYSVKFFYNVKNADAYCWQKNILFFTLLEFNEGFEKLVSQYSKC